MSKRMMLIDVFAENVRFYRKAAGLSQEELANKSGLHRTYIGGIECANRNASLKSIEKIAAALGIAPSLLLQQIDSKDETDG